MMAVTPFMQQYLEIKEKYKDYVLFFRLGDFYEMFNEDALLVSRELELTLTGRDCGEEERAPMCGIPYHSAESYIGRLIAKGYKIAICEQLEDPALVKGLVKRDVVRIITPGTLIENSMLDERANNYLCAVFAEDGGMSAAFIDISTGEMHATASEGEEAETYITNELGAYAPREVLLNVSKTAYSKLGAFLCDRLHAMVEDGVSYRFEGAAERVRRQFPDKIQEIPDGARGKRMVAAVGALLDYVAETQKTDISYIRKLNLYYNGQYMEMDVNTRRNLELCETMRQKERRGSLLWVLDRTRTAMGARNLRKWVEMPLTDVKQIHRRQQAVQSLYDHYMEREEIGLHLKDVLDLERLITRIVYNTAGPKDMRAIANTIAVIPPIRALLAELNCPELLCIREELDDLQDLYTLIDRAICEDPPFSVREGGFIRDGYAKEVDALRDILNDGSTWKSKIEEEERAATGIPKLKIGYNKVFGYYIEVTNSYKSLVPDRYIRKQTLSGSERYITQELKDMEATVLGAKDKNYALEYELFQEIRETLCTQVERIQKSAALLADIDAYSSLAEAANRNHYVCPEVDESDVIDIRDGRHPVVEKFAGDNYFVPNDTLLDNDVHRLALITGPNMAGKSTYMRQVALITVMAQIGSFVPAKSARIGVVDRVFTRVGASDDLASGQSTFMLEMTEVAYILAHATRKSLIIYDEIGRGTSTYDGMSIARAVLEYTLGKKIGAKTLFATHYHELTEIEGQLTGVVNYNIAAKKKGDDIIFLRKIVPGAADDSYGIEVAKLAGIPNEVIKRSKEVLLQLDAGKEVKVRGRKKLVPMEEQCSMDFDAAIDAPCADGGDIDYQAQEMKKRIQDTDINSLTPMAALNLLYELKNMVTEV
ncbi:MAG: DNA mismatch repair protein MutS [Clostridia bacterium]|nr:DNA mismatch repair protein MutS [Clostridia bacterium]